YGWSYCGYRATPTLTHPPNFPFRNAPHPPRKFRPPSEDPYRRWYWLPRLTPGMLSAGNPTTLDLNYRRLLELPADIYTRVEVEKSVADRLIRRLSLAYNLLTALPRFILKFHNLVNVNLRSNNFFEFPRALCHLPNLAILDISRNRIRYLPKEPGRLLNLQMLNISRNKLVQLPNYVARMGRLEKLKLEGNPFAESNELFARERLQDRKGWPQTLFPHLRAAEAAGKEGLGCQFSRGPGRVKPTPSHSAGARVVSPTQVQVSRRSQSSGSQLSEPRVSRRPLTILCSDASSHSSADEAFETRRPGRPFISTVEESPDSSPSPSPIGNAWSADGSPVAAGGRDANGLAYQTFCVQSRPPGKVVDAEKFGAFERAVYCGYFLGERAEVWAEHVGDDHLKDLRSQLLADVAAMAQQMAQPEIAWRELEGVAKRLTSRLVAFSHALQDALAKWGESVSLPSLQSLAFVLMESTFHVKAASASLKKVYALDAASAVTFEGLQPHNPNLPTPQALAQFPRFGSPSPLPIPHRAGLPGPRTEPAPPIRAHGDQLRLQMHPAAEGARPRPSRPLDSALHLAEDSTHLLVSSLSLVTSSPTPPLPLTHRFVQDVFSFVKDIIQLAQVVKSHLSADPRRAALPPALVAHLQTLTHTTRQLAGRLTK
ncbi:hypothetical protein L0F63_005164, partial [Massospora cicadina]